MRVERAGHAIVHVAIHIVVIHSGAAGLDHDPSDHHSDNRNVADDPDRPDDDLDPGGQLRPDRFGRRLIARHLR